METVEDVVQQDIKEQRALEEKRRTEQMPKGSVLKQLEWATQKSQIENQQRDVYKRQEELYKFESTVVGGAIPKEYIPAVGEGIEEAMKAGILGGFPVVGVHANLYDGSYHEVDSSEMAFHIAGSLAFKEAMQKGAPVLLEPIMNCLLYTSS